MIRCDHHNITKNCNIMFPLLQVEDIFRVVQDTMKDMIVPQKTSNTKQLIRMDSHGDLDSSVMSNSQQYEVMYVGRLRVASKRAPPEFIDDAVERFKELEVQKQKELSQLNQDSSDRDRCGSGSSTSSLIMNSTGDSGLTGGILTSPFSPDYCSSYSPYNSITRPRSISSLTTCDERREEELTQETLHQNISNVPKLNLVPEDSCLTSVSSTTAVPIVVTSASTTCNVNLELSTPTSLISSSQSLDERSRESIIQDLKGVAESEKRESLKNDHKIRVTPVEITTDHHPLGSVASKSDDDKISKEPVNRQVSLPVGRSRTNSGGKSDFQKCSSSPGVMSPRRSRRLYQNRPMLFLIGRLELRLISTDHHQILLNKTFNHVSHCSQGIMNKDHFGFICRDKESSMTSCESYVGFIFRCQSEKLVEEILHSLRQAFHNAHQTYSNSLKAKSVKSSCILCETCPMKWFHTLCVSIEDCDDEKTWVILMKSVNESYLNEDEKDEIMTKYSSIKSFNSTSEQNEIFMMILRGLCERKQSKHQHVIPNDTHGYLEKKSSSIDVFKHHVSSSLESLLKVSFMLISCFIS